MALDLNIDDIIAENPMTAVNKTLLPWNVFSFQDPPGTTSVQEVAQTYGLPLKVRDSYGILSLLEEVSGGAMYESAGTRDIVPSDWKVRVVLD